MLSPGKLQAVAGTYVADGSAVEALFNKFVDGPALKAIIKKILRESSGGDASADVSITKTDADAYKGIKFHQVSIKWPEEVDEKVRKVFGEPLTLYFGTGPHSAYLTVGAGSMEVLKKAIDASAAEPNKAVIPMQASASVGSIVSFIASLMDEDSSSSGLNTFADELKKVKGKDHIVVNAKPISNGTSIRLQVEDGVLEAIMQTSKLKMKGMSGKPGAAGPMGPQGNQPND